MTKAALRPIPGHEPKITERDATVFDKAQVIPFPIVVRPSTPAVSYLVKPKKPKPFISLSGEIVWRFRGGKGFTPYREPWDASGLLRVRGRLMTEPKIVAMARELEAGRPPNDDLITINGTRVWTDYPQRWNAEEPGPGPYVLRAAAELAAAGADVSGSNLPGVREYDEWAKRLRRLVDTGDTLGPKLDDPERLDQIWAGQTARQIYRLELEERKSFNRERVWMPGMPMRADFGRKVNTSEFRNEVTGECGPQTTVGRDGRVVFKNGQPALNRGGVSVRSLDDYSQRARVRCADGKLRRVDAQRGIIERRGRKPKFGKAMTNAERQRLFRARKREMKNEHSTDS